MAKQKRMKDFSKSMERMRRTVISIKGSAVEGLTPLEKEKNASAGKVLSSKEKELVQ